MWPLLSKPLYISMRRRKMYFLVYKVIRNRSILGPCQFLIFITKHLVKFVLSICLETWKNLNGRNLEKWRICMEMWRIFKEKWKTIWKNAEFDWKSERIYMAKIWKSEEFVWKREGFIKKSEEFLWKNDEFVWTSERIYMVQRYSKYRFFGVNCIPRYSQYRFSSSIPGMPGEAKISIPYSVWVEDLIYIYIHVVMSWDVLSVGVSTADW